MGEQFSVAWRVLDAQHWPGTPQRRKRIYLVADFAGGAAPEILFEQDRLLGHPAPGEETREGAAARAAGGAGDTGGGPPIAGEHDAGCLTPWDIQSHRIYGNSGVWPSLYSGGGGRHGYVSTEKEDTPTEKAPIAFACNQRDEVRDLHDVSGSIQAQPGMKQQTFIAQPAEVESADGEEAGFQNPNAPPFAAGVVAKGNGDCFLTPGRHAPLTAGGGQAGQGYPCVLVAGFSAGAGSSASGIGYQEECAPTLKASASGNMMPSILCINDQGGKRMDLSCDVSGTLRARMDGHPPLVLGDQPELFENHGIDARYTGPHEVAPTMSARYGTGGDNVPLVAQAEQPGESYCISGNIIDRQDHNGGNGIGVQADISYTVTATDRHCVFSQQRSDEYTPNSVVSTQSARQYKDATDLVCETDGAYQQTVGALCESDKRGIGSQYVEQDKCVVEQKRLIRRLTPLECERLQGYPDHWTDIDGACDSARYKALGNSVAIPCVEYVLRGIAFFLRKCKEG
ncbi:MAG: DNA cytosine methyltransferase [Ethanoligenens sp.]